jgi:hypothetical protein
MADTTTPNLGLTKIEIAGSEDTWGDKLNDNADKIDQQVAKKTDMTTALGLKADKTYVDSQDAALNASIAGKAAIVHTHPISQVDGLQTALDGKQPAGSYAAASHTHAIADVTGLQTALDGKQAAGSYAPASHTHTTAQVTGLDAALAAKLDKTGGTMTGNLTIQNGAPSVFLGQTGIATWLLTMQGNNGTVGVQRASDGRWAWYGDGSDLFSPGNVVAYWSDERLKEKILPLDGYEERIMGLRPVSFAWNEKGRAINRKAPDEREIGFIAQEAQAVDARFVAENPTALDDDGNAYLTVKKDEMIADLVALVQSLNKRVRDLEEMLG